MTHSTAVQNFEHGGFQSLLRRRVDDGERTSFWKHSWTGKHLLPRLFLLSLYPNANEKQAECEETEGNNCRWNWKCMATPRGLLVVEIAAVLSEIRCARSLGMDARSDERIFRSFVRSRVLQLPLNVYNN